MAGFDAPTPGNAPFTTPHPTAVLIDPISGAAMGSTDNPLAVALPAPSRAPIALLTAAVAVATGAFVQTPGSGFSVVVSGSTTAGAGAATAVIEGSHDGIVPITLATITLTLGTVAVADGFGSAVPYRYVRARLSVLSGTGASVSATLGS